MRISILFDNLGPYHLARIRAASTEVDVLAIEFAGRSSEYDWEPGNAEESFDRVTLFSDLKRTEISAKDIKQRLDKTLCLFFPEVVVVPGWSSRFAFIAMQWCLKHAVPVVVMSESTAHDEARAFFREFVKRRYVGLASAGLVGGQLHADYLAQLGMDSEAICLGYDAVDNKYFDSHATMAAVDNEPEPYFLASARFIEKKNLFRLLEAYAGYRKVASKKDGGSREHELWDLVLLGDGLLKNELQQMRTELDLEEFVNMPGFIQYPELPGFYSKAGAFIHASTTEQWGLVVNEAMASGLPVLVSNRCGCAHDLVKEGRNGFTFDPLQVHALAGLMVKLTSMSEKERLALGKASGEMIADWGPGRFASGLKAAAEKALEVGPKKASFSDRMMLKLLIRKT